VIDLPRLSKSLSASSAELALLAALLCWCAGVPCAWCARKGAARPVSGPQVLVLVLSGIGAFDQVSINYNSKIPKGEALKDIESLVRETAWPVRDPRVTVAQPSTPGAKRTTSSVFRTPPLANTRDGTLPLEPFILALRRFGSIQVNYLIASQFAFRGLEDFENDRVKITLRQAGNSYQYSVRVKKGDFDRLTLPLKPAENAPRQPPGMSVAARAMLILGLALAGAVIAYLVAAHVARERRS
jgi:hypothetical protein